MCGSTIEDAVCYSPNFRRGSFKEMPLCAPLSVSRVGLSIESIGVGIYIYIFWKSGSYCIYISMTEGGDGAKEVTSHVVSSLCHTQSTGVKILGPQIKICEWC